jgi:hypothetical protein
MIQLNLLPDVKQHFMQARRLQRLTVTSAFVVTAAAVTLFVLLFLTVNVWQKQRIKALSGDIERVSNQLKSTPDLDRILTVQQQLRSLPALHDQKPAATRLARYLSQITPLEITVSKFRADFVNYTFNISGESDKLESVNKFVDTLKFTKYKSAESEELKPAFSNVVLKTFGTNEDTASYEITLNFDFTFFNITAKDLELVVPQDFITTRSETERPEALFETPSEEPGQGEQ